VTESVVEGDAFCFCQTCFQSGCARQLF